MYDGAHLTSLYGAVLVACSHASQGCRANRAGLSVEDARQSGWRQAEEDCGGSGGARARMQEGLLGGSRPRASGAGSSSQDIGGDAVAFESTEAAAAADRAVPAAAEQPAAAADDVLEQGGAPADADQQVRAVV